MIPPNRNVESTTLDGDQSTVIASNEDASTCQRLRPEHINYLTERAIPLDSPAVAYLASVDSGDIQELLDLQTPPESDGLAFFYETNPPYIRVRLDEPREGSARYLVPTGQAVPIFLVPGVDYTGAKRIIVVEAPAKAISVSANFEPAVVGLGGVATTLAGGELGDSWRAIDLHGREVVVLFDANRATNPAVAVGEARLARALARAGGRVRIAQLNLVTDDEKDGPDDVIAHRGSGEIDLAMADAVEAAPLARVNTESLAGLAADMCFFASVHVLPAAERNLVRAAWGARRERGAGVKLFDDQLDAFEQDLRATVENGVPAPKYEIADGKIVSIGEHVRVITEGVLQIVEQRESELREYTFLVEATSREGIPLGRAVVTSKELESAEWITRHFGAGVVPHGWPRDLKSALLSLAVPERVLLVERPGFVEAQGGLIYVHGEGQIGTESALVRADLADPVNAYVLPSSSARGREGFKLALRLLEAVPAHVAFALLACVGAAILAHFFRPRFCLFLVGKSGSFKTTLGQVVLSFFGTFERRGTIDMASTYAAIEDVLHRAKDVPALLDDYAPGANPTLAEHYKEVVAKVIRSIGNGLGRDRMTVDLRRQPNRAPRGIAIITGEEPPSATESIQNRTVMIRITKDDVNLTALQAVQDGAALLPSAARVLIERVIEHPAAVKTSFQRARSTAMQAVSIGGHSHRAAESIAHLRAGFDFFVDTALHQGAVDAQRAEELRDVADEVIATLLTEQDDAQTSVDAVERFLEALYSAWTVGDLVIAQASGGAQGAHGYLDLSKGRLYLSFDATWKALAGRQRNAGETMGASQQEIVKRLIERDLVRVDEAGRFARKVLVGGRRVRMVDLALDPDRIPAHAHGGTGLSRGATGFGARVPGVVATTDPAASSVESEEA